MKICIISSGRADFGLLKNLILKFQKEKINYKFVVLGSHFSKYYGSTIDEIKKSKINIYKKIPNKIDTSDEIGISKTIALCVISMTKILKKLLPDILVVLGDRYEILACVLSAHICKIPVAHIHGGELTHAIIDDAFRHSITKMSQIHFVANKVYRKRVIQLGEDPKKAYVVGGLGVDSIKSTKFLSKTDLERKFSFKFKKRNILINFHPETLNKKSARYQINEVLGAVKTLKNTFIIFTMPGAELENKIIVNRIKNFVKKSKNAFFYKSFGQKNYFSILNVIDVMLGNSSSGLLEMPTFKKATINLGNRQSGRLKSLSVIDTKIKKKFIINALNKVYSKKFQEKLKKTINPYGKGGATSKIVKILKKLKFNNLINKKFYDI
jgi:GDP/UDP-N,N'-diacetylbacillosamine 2-epimerase (hydrolysing)